MPFTLNKVALTGNAAGLAIHDNYLRFIEIDEDSYKNRTKREPMYQALVKRYASKHAKVISFQEVWC